MQKPRQHVILSVCQIQNFLKVTYQEALAIMESESLPKMIIGKSQRVLKKDLLDWLVYNNYPIRQ